MVRVGAVGCALQLLAERDGWTGLLVSAFVVALVAGGSVASVALHVRRPQLSCDAMARAWRELQHCCGVCVPCIRGLDATKVHMPRLMHVGRNSYSRSGGRLICVAVSRGE